MTILTLCNQFPVARTELLREIKYLQEDGLTEYNQLPDFTQRKLAGMLLRCMDPIHMYEWLCDHRNGADFITMFAGALVRDNPESYERVMDELLDQVTDWAEPHLDELLKDSQE